MNKMTILVCIKRDIIAKTVQDPKKTTQIIQEQLAAQFTRMRIEMICSGPNLSYFRRGKAIGT